MPHCPEQIPWATWNCPTRSGAQTLERQLECSMRNCVRCFYSVGCLKIRSMAMLSRGLEAGQLLFTPAVDQDLPCRALLNSVLEFLPHLKSLALSVPHLLLDRFADVK